jgi:hypothetical protein
VLDTRNKLLSDSWAAPSEVVSDAADHLSSKQLMTRTEHRLLDGCHPRRLLSAPLTAAQLPSGHSTFSAVGQTKIECSLMPRRGVADR